MGTVLQKLLQCGSLSLTTNNLLLCGFSMGRSFIQDTSACSSVGILHGLQRYSLPPHGLLQGSTCSGVWSISSHSFTDWGASFLLFSCPFLSPSGIWPFLRWFPWVTTTLAIPCPAHWSCSCLCIPGLSWLRLPNSQPSPRAPLRLLDVSKTTVRLLGKNPNKQLSLVC